MRTSERLALFCIFVAAADMVSYCVTALYFVDWSSPDREAQHRASHADKHLLVTHTAFFAYYVCRFPYLFEQNKPALFSWLESRYFLQAIAYGPLMLGVANLSETGIFARCLEPPVHMHIWQFWLVTVGAASFLLDMYFQGNEAFERLGLGLRRQPAILERAERSFRMLPAAG